MDDPHAEVEIKPQLRPRGGVAEGEDPKPSHHYASCRLNPQDQLGRLCVQGIYERSLRALVKENALALIAEDTGGKNTEEWDQIRIRAAPTAGPEISTVLEGILGRGGGL